ncbi:MAG: aldehyde ferredoxin oxidoreductase C-terminal domain-containing protein [Desulfovibrio sp.]
MHPEILHIDLTAATSRRVPCDASALGCARGGRGLAGLLLDESAPDAAVCFAPGRLAGFDLPGAGHVSLAFFSPRTGGAAVATLGGSLGHALARARLAGVVLTGRSACPVGLTIRDEAVRFVDAAGLVGRTTTEIFDSLLGEYDAAAVTGPAALSGSPLATVAADRWHDAGGMGAGLAMAVKNVVFLAASGTAEIHPADAAGLDAARAAMERLIAAAPTLAGPCGFGRFGTAALVDLTAGRRMQPTDNFRRTFFPEATAVNAPRLEALFQGHGETCPGCPVGCRRVDATGRLLPDVDALSHFTALLGLADPDLAVFARHYCLDQGLDAAGCAVVLAAEAERTGESPTPEGVRQGLASLAAMDDAGRALLAAPALRVRGVELPAFDPRGAYGLALSLAVGASGPDPWRAGCLAHELLRKPVATDRFTFEGKARAVFLGEAAVAAAACLAGCPWLGLAIGLEEWALALSAVTGEPVAAGDLAALGQAVVARERARNARCGLTAADDDLPPRFFTEPGSGGDGIDVPPLDRAAFLAARAKYYRLCGLSAEGLPLAASREASWTR